LDLSYAIDKAYCIAVAVRVGIMLSVEPQGNRATGEQKELRNRCSELQTLKVIYTTGVPS